MDSVHDRRSHPRVPATVRVHVYYDEGPGQGCWTHDVSENGIRLGFAGAPVRARVQLVVDLPVNAGAHGQPHVVWGRVAWRTLKSTGLELITPPPEVRNQLRAFVADNAVSA